MTVEMKFEPIQAAPGSKVNFGVTVTGADLNNISGMFGTLHNTSNELSMLTPAQTRTLTL